MLVTDHRFAVSGFAIGNRAIREGDFEYDAARIGPKRSMHLSRRTTCIVAGLEPETEGRVIQSAADDEDLLGVGVAFAAKRHGIGAGQETCQARVFLRIRVSAQREFLGSAFQPRDGLPFYRALR